MRAFSTISRTLVARLVMLWVMLMACTANGRAQDIDDTRTEPVLYTDTITMQTDNMSFEQLNSLADTFTFVTDTLVKQKRDWSTWRPDAKRATWLALVLPGMGQIYNRKYWKLPIVYGGFVGCIYALNWNNMMYRDYSQGYLDICDNDPTTESYNQFLHLGQQVDDSNRERYKTLFKKRKDYYRRYRDMSFFILVGVYALSVVDAYVDASLSDFDINKDLSMRIAPTFIHKGYRTDILHQGTLGLRCSLTF